MKLAFPFLLVSLATVVGGCRQSPPPEPSASQRGVEPVHLTDANFQAEVIESDVPVLVDMWAPWCQPCIDMKPTIHELAEELAGKVKVAELKIDENPFIKAKYSVDQYPMLLIFNSGVESQRLIGVKSKQELIDAIDVSIK